MFFTSAVVFRSFHTFGIRSENEIKERRIRRITHKVRVETSEEEKRALLVCVTAGWQEASLVAADNCGVRVEENSRE